MTDFLTAIVYIIHIHVLIYSAFGCVFDNSVSWYKVLRTTQFVLTSTS